MRRVDPGLSKQLADTVKMIAYRAETAMVAMLRKHLNKEDEARALVVTRHANFDN